MLQPVTLSASRANRPHSSRRVYTLQSHAALHSEELEERRLLSVTPEMLMDINTDNEFSVVHQSLATAGGLVYFYGRGDSTTIWRTDGTQEGTFGLGVTEKLAVGIYLEDSVDLNGQLLFWGGVIRSELWITDGTEEGTRLVLQQTTLDIKHHAPIYVPDNLAYFLLSDGTHGQELWKTDGTPQGTAMVKDIFPGEGSSNITNMTTLGDSLYFIADDGIHGSELWRINKTGTAELVRDILPGILGSEITNLTVVDDSLYFTAKDTLHGRELWRVTNSEPAEMIVDLVPGSESSQISQLINVNGTLYFTQSTKDDSTLLIKVTPSGTADSFYKLKSSNAYHLTDFNGTLVFEVYSPESGKSQLWKSDGTEAGTLQIAGDFVFNSEPSLITAPFTHLNNNLYFVTPVDKQDPPSSPAERELWRTDGTEAGTQSLRTITLYSDSRTAHTPTGDLTPLGDRLLFTDRQPDNTQALWSTDGSTEGTERLSKYRMSSLNATIVGDKAYFIESDVLWQTNGTLAGTKQLTGIDPPTRSSREIDSTIFEIDGIAYFSANGGELTDNKDRPWRTDGTAEGTYLIDRGPADPKYKLTGSDLYYSYVSSLGLLRVSDGTFEGSFIATPSEMTYVLTPVAAGETVYFGGEHTSLGVGLWKTDGTILGTVEVFSFASPREYTKFYRHFLI